MLMVLLRMVLLTSIACMVVFAVRVAHDLVFEFNQDRPMWILCFVMMVVMLCGIIGMTITLVSTLQIT